MKRTLVLQETWLTSFNVVGLLNAVPGYRWFHKTADEHPLIEDRLVTSNLGYHGVATGVL